MFQKIHWKNTDLDYLDSLFKASVARAYDSRNPARAYMPALSYQFDYRTRANKWSSWLVAAPKNVTKNRCILAKFCTIVYDKNIRNLARHIIVQGWKNNFWKEAASFIGAGTVFD